MANRLGGQNRYETATKISSAIYKTVNTVVLVIGQNEVVSETEYINRFFDALIATPLARAYNAPLLLVTKDSIGSYAKTELKSLKAKKIIVINTNGAISSVAKAELNALKVSITYIEGNTCFETATKVANALQAKIGKAPDTIFFITNSSCADGLSIGPVAAITKSPIIYLKPTGSIDSITTNYLNSVKSSVKNAYIIGGTAVISDTVMSSVASILGLTVNNTIQRISGADRFDTCIAINNKFSSILSDSGICVATGIDSADTFTGEYADASTGGVYAAKNKRAILLVNSKSSKLQTSQTTYLKSKKPNSITVFGNTGAVSDSLVKLIEQASK